MPTCKGPIDLPVALLAGVVEVIKGFHQPLSHRAAIILAKGNRGYLELSAVMTLFQSMFPEPGTPRSLSER